MDDFSFDFSQVDEFLWFGNDNLNLPLPLPVPSAAAVYHDHYSQRSAFVSYSREALLGVHSKPGGNGNGSLRVAVGRPNDQNVHRRMMGFLKKQWNSTAAVGAVEAERERNHKHMINERMRRVKQRQGYTELHKLLPLGTKSDKNSIVQMAAETIEQLQRDNQELKKRKTELEMALAVRSNHDNNRKGEEAKIKLRVAHPSSGIDSMLEVLNSLKRTGTQIKALQSSFSSQEFSAVLQIEATIAGAEVEKAVQNALYEVERKFRCAATPPMIQHDQISEPPPPLPLYRHFT